VGSDWRAAARGRWDGILSSLGGISEEFLQNDHGPCPLCGGTKRFRWDDRDGDGGGYCNDCGGPRQAGGSLSGMDLLLRAKGWDFKTGVRELERFLGMADEIPVKKRGRKPARKPEYPPDGVGAPDLAGAVMQWCYRDAGGRVLFYIQRINLRDGKKLFIHRTWIDGKWHRPSKDDPFTSEWPAPRPIYRLPELVASGNEPVLICEGEKSADAAAGMLLEHVAISWSNGSKAIDRVDWSPLQGRHVLISRDNDDAGVDCTQRLGAALAGVAASVTVLDPPAGAPPKWDLADPWPAEGGAFDEWLSGCIDFAAWNASDGDGNLLIQPETQGETVAAAPVRGVAKLPITCLGFNGDDYFYQSGDSGQVTRVSKTQHSPTPLMALADLRLWEDAYPRKDDEGNITGVAWKEAVNDLFRAQHRVGVYDSGRVRGIGAWYDDGRTVFHLGDRLIVDGERFPVLSPPESRFLYQRLPHRDGPGAAVPLTDDEGLGLLMLSERFHWERPGSGRLLAGWVALAPICGALDWRPHLWLQAVAGSGKSSILEMYVSHLLNDMVLRVVGATTEAGIRQTLRSDAIPVVFDESESNQRRDAERIQSVLALARIASSEGEGKTLKGSAAGEATMFNVRSMFMLSSIATALAQGADRSRFTTLSLRIPDTLTSEEKRAHWVALEADLRAQVSPETGRRLLSRMVQLIPVVRKAARVFASVAAVETDSARAGDQMGTLLAGAWMLQYSIPPTPEQALEFARGADLAAHSRQADEVGGDQRDCLETLLQSRLRVELDVGGTSRTVAELLEIAAGESPRGALEPVSPEAAADELGRYGIRLEGAYVLFSNTSKGIKKLLQETPWNSGGWANLLAALPNAQRWGVTRFRGLATPTRAVGIPRSLMETAV